jgi:cell wall-associated NlpC family hydrolase
LHRIRRRRRRVNGKFAASAVVAGLLLAASHPHALPVSGAAASTAPSPAAATAIAYARAQLGKPYVYGATGPDAFDCSGLVMAAWAAAGLSIPRTSEQQWADLPHVTTPEPGDLVFYTGNPIDPPPGHVTMYLGGGQMIEAYGIGVPIRITALRSGVWGYADPGGAS